MVKIHSAKDGDTPLTLLHTANGAPISAATTVGLLRQTIATTQRVQLAAVQLEIDGTPALDDDALLGDAYHGDHDAYKYWYTLCEQPLLENGYRPLRSETRASLSSCSKCHRPIVLSGSKWPHPHHHHKHMDCVGVNNANNNNNGAVPNTAAAAAAVAALGDTDADDDNDDGNEADLLGWTAHACGHYVCPDCLATTPEALQPSPSSIVCPICCVRTQGLVFLPARSVETPPSALDTPLEHAAPVYEVVSGVLPSLEQLERALCCKLKTNGCPNRATASDSFGRPGCDACIRLFLDPKVEAGTFTSSSASLLTPPDVLCVHEHVRPEGFHALVAQQYCVDCEKSVCAVCVHDDDHRGHVTRRLRWEENSKNQEEEDRTVLRLWSSQTAALLHAEQSQREGLEQYRKVCDNDQTVVPSIVADAETQIQKGDQYFDDKIAWHLAAIERLKRDKEVHRARVTERKWADLKAHRETVEHSLNTLRDFFDRLRATKKGLLDRHVLLTQVMEAAPELLLLKDFSVTNFTTELGIEVLRETLDNALRKASAILGDDSSTHPPSGDEGNEENRKRLEEHAFMAEVLDAVPELRPFAAETLPNNNNNNNATNFSNAVIELRCALEALQTNVNKNKEAQNDARRTLTERVLVSSRTLSSSMIPLSYPLSAWEATRKVQQLVSDEHAVQVKKWNEAVRVASEAVQALHHDACTSADAVLEHNKETVKLCEMLRRAQQDAETHAKDAEALRERAVKFTEDSRTCQEDAAKCRQKGNVGNFHERANNSEIEARQLSDAAKEMELLANASQEACVRFQQEARRVKEQIKHHTRAAETARKKETACNAQAKPLREEIQKSNDAIGRWCTALLRATNVLTAPSSGTSATAKEGGGSGGGGAGDSKTAVAATAADNEMPSSGVPLWSQVLDLCREVMRMNDDVHPLGRRNAMATNFAPDDGNERMLCKRCPALGTTATKEAGGDDEEGGNKCRETAAESTAHCDSDRSRHIILTTTTTKSPTAAAAAEEEGLADDVVTLVTEQYPIPVVLPHSFGGVACDAVVAGGGEHNNDVSNDPCCCCRRRSSFEETVSFLNKKLRRNTAA